MTKYGDIKIVFNPTVAGGYCDIIIEDGDFKREEGLFTAVVISLFSDIRVSPSESYSREARGNWSDEIIGFNLGSRLWLLGRSRLNNDTFRKAEQYSQDALQWMIDENVATEIISTATAENKRLKLKIQIKGPGEDELETFIFKLEWAAQMNEVR